MTRHLPWVGPLLLLGAMCALGCGEDTGPRRTSFPVEVAGRGGQAMSNDHGYTVTLSEARIHLGPVRFFSGEPLFTRAATESWPWRVARRILGIGLAHAHPGHYQQGEALAEVLDAATFDLLATAPGPLGQASGVTGAYRSVQVAITKTADLKGHSVLVRGMASKGSHAVDFSAALDLQEEVEGVAFGAQVDGTPGRVRLEVDLSCWVERVDFSLLHRGPGAEVSIQPGSQAENALLRGVNNTSAFKLTWINDKP